MVKKIFTTIKNLHWLLQLLILGSVLSLLKIPSVSNYQSIILTFSGGLIIGLLAAFLFNKKGVSTSQSSEFEKHQESLKNIQKLMDELSKKTPITNNTSSTITKDAPPVSPVPHCAIIMQGQSVEGYVIPYNIEGENVYQSSSKQGLAFRHALRVLKQRGHNFNVLKPRGTLGNYISKDRIQQSKFDPLNQLEFPVNLMSNN
ncbi:hypothetical protein DID80_03690 [Candidatus Marinamargulisbacteria bacterium SCGC AAA071-K20]|nr:hypothetical protein DID80_03690 [Candidatus Marinamargulisbacteria bacterium SCGC AAA071-K20]